MIKEHKALVYNSNWLLILMRMRTTNKRKKWEKTRNDNKPFVVIICCVVYVAAVITSWVVLLSTGFDAILKWKFLLEYDTFSFKIEFLKWRMRKFTSFDQRVHFWSKILTVIFEFKD